MDSRAMDDKLKPGEVPRMMGAADLALIEQFAASLQGTPRLVEVGPWLGGVSHVLAGYGALHVIDRFIWSDKNAQNHPGIAEPGASFRALFEANVSDAPHPVQIHEADFRAFDWAGGRIDLCLIDAPRTAADLIACLRGLRGGLDERSLLLIKNGLSPAHVELPAILEILLGARILRPVPSRQPPWCSILVVAPGPEWQRVPKPSDCAALLDRQPLSAAVRDPWGGLSLGLARIAERLRRNDWHGALRRAAECPAATGALAQWDAFERAGDLAPAEELTVLADLLAVQTDPTASLRLPVPVNRGPISALRGYWANCASQPWRVQDFDADLIAQAAQQGATELPATLGARILGQRVLEIAPEAELSGVGFLAGGAAVYLGLCLRPISAAMMAAEAQMSALRHLPLDTPEPLAAVDLVVLRVDQRGDPAVSKALAKLPRATPRVMVKRGRNGVSYEIA